MEVDNRYLCQFNAMYSVSHLIQTPGDHVIFSLLKGVLIEVTQHRRQFQKKVPLDLVSDIYYCLNISKMVNHIMN